MTHPLETPDTVRVHASPPAEAQDAPDGRRRPAHPADLNVGGPDCIGRTIVEIYFQSPEYAIYKAGGRIHVHHAVADRLRDRQVKALVPLNALRAKLRARLGRLTRHRGEFEWRIASALRSALEGHSEAGENELLDAIAERKREQERDGRAQYLALALGTAVVLAAALSLAGAPATPAAEDILLGARAGVIGALLSMVIAFRGRTVGWSDDITGNVTDGLARLVVGLLSGAIIVLIAGSGILPPLQIGDQPVTGSKTSWMTVMLLGVVAGFSERFVPDLLNDRFANQDRLQESNALHAAHQPAPTDPAADQTDNTPPPPTPEPDTHRPPLH